MLPSLQRLATIQDSTHPALIASLLRVKDFRSHSVPFRTLKNCYHTHSTQSGQPFQPYAEELHSLPIAATTLFEGRTREGTQTRHNLLSTLTGRTIDQTKFAIINIFVKCQQYLRRILQAWDPICVGARFDALGTWE